MSINMHSASSPVFVKMLGNMLHWLQLARTHAETKKFDTSVYLGLRLAPDMLPFSRQIQIASDAAKGCVARLGGIEIPKWEDNEATLDELEARVRRTIDFVNSVPAEQLIGSEERVIELVMRNGTVLKYSGEDFLRHYATPNFYFHVTTTYALLRHAGVSLGKPDYLGRS